MKELKTSERIEFELLIEGLMSNGVGVSDRFLSEELALGLQSNLRGYYEAGLMHPAGVGRKFDFIQNTKVRGDVIKWLDTDSKNGFEGKFLGKIHRFVQYLNATCYTSLSDYEFHYACYQKHSFYQRHLDQFKSNKGRKYSMVCYLNDEWTEHDGGQISLYLPGGEVRLFPILGRVIFFQSDITEHEVHPSTTRRRMSIAGWLKTTTGTVA